MTIVYWLLFAQGVLGAFDTLYFHEWRARLPARVPQSSPELKLHALRDFLYTILFGSLPWVEWHGAAAFVLASILLAEVVITLSDFVVEVRVRKPLGDVEGGERITHASMAILFGAMLAQFIPVLMDWMSKPTGIVLIHSTGIPVLRWVLLAMATGVFLSGVRDLGAVRGARMGRWPWNRIS